jgi:hypothetical protein
MHVVPYVCIKYEAINALCEGVCLCGVGVGGGSHSVKRVSDAGFDCSEAGGE